MPAILQATPRYILRGYGPDDRIVYGTGSVVPTHEICTRAHELLQRREIAYLHIRSASNNCYQVQKKTRGPVGRSAFKPDQAASTVLGSAIS